MRVKILEIHSTTNSEEISKLDKYTYIYIYIHTHVAKTILGRSGGQRPLKRKIQSCNKEVLITKY